MRGAKDDSQKVVRTVPCADEAIWRILLGNIPNRPSRSSFHDPEGIAASGDKGR